MKSHGNIWNQCLEIVRDNVSENVFGTWFTPVIPYKYEGNDFIIQVPTQFFYEFLEEHYADLIYQALARVSGNPDIHLIYRPVVDSTSPNKGRVLLPSEHLTVNDNLYTAKNLNKSPNELTDSNLVAWDAHLNAHLNFKNYFEGTSNKAARAIALKVAQEPGKDFNPYFIYGACGVGKTHLCHAIGNQIVELHPDKKVLYISAHLFQVQFSDARLKNTSNDFVHFYQGVDVLILDDIHELAGKTKTQDAFFHIFNHLTLNGKQIIFTADKAPAQIEGLEDRLLSRLISGLTLELQKPDLELRKKILYNKIKQDGLTIADDIINYIAENVTDHVRNLKGIITSLVAQSLFSKIDLDLTKRVVLQTTNVKKKEITLDKIQDIVSSYFKVNINDIHSKSRKREIVQARQVAMFLAKKHTKHSFSHIGLIIGKRDHATVTHACKTVQNDLSTDKGFKATVLEIETRLKN
ncbi:MAG: chromosomal replication initiator protein DnaA [Candidatus Symbiothrix sp.]|jgi:chromosomal replication initiator protein|nr:chromosomal replication initiator protein DnaA [Candidatus Symbiothrix sp.]